MSRRTFLSLCGGALASLPLAGCSSGSSSSSSSATTDAASTEEATTSSSDVATDATAIDEKYATGTHHATIEVADYGTMTVELNAVIAPITVANFGHLADSGFYDGLTFHRIIKDFMIQGGDPTGTGSGGSDQKIKGEFSQNGVVNTISHVRGTISMARSSAYDSASSQFFIMQTTTTSLDGQYAAFGHVTEGIEIVDAICEAVPVEDSNGTVAAQDQPVITSIKMVD